MRIFQKNRNISDRKRLKTLIFCNFLLIHMKIYLITLRSRIRCAASITEKLGVFNFEHSITALFGAVMIFLV